MPRKYLPTLADLIDRLSIVQLKEVLGDRQHRKEHAQEIQSILSDIDTLLKQRPIVAGGADVLRAIVVLAEMNALIWQRESHAENYYDFQRIRQLNGVRIRAKNKIEEFSGGRKDHKIDCISAEIPEWEPSW